MKNFVVRASVAGVLALGMAACSDSGDRRAHAPVEATGVSPDPMRTETGQTAAEAAANASADALERAGERAGDPTGH